MTAYDSSKEQFDFGRVTGRVFDLIGRNFVAFFVLALIFTGLPSLVVGLFATPPVPGVVELPGIGFFAAALVAMIASILLQGALTRASLDDLSGKGVSIGSALSTAVGLFLPLLGLGILVGLGIMVGLILLIVPGIILALRWIVASPALVAEKSGVFNAMERSAKLTEGHRWAILGLIALFIVLAVIVNFITMAIAGGFDGATAAAGGSIVSMMISTCLEAVVSMISTVGVASIYFELRQIKEGVGVAEIAAVFE